MHSMDLYKHASHLTALQSAYRRDSLKRAVDALQNITFDTIAFSGISGAIFVPSLADMLGKEIICVRKPDDKNNHSGHRVEGFAAAKNYIFVDDLVSTGRTLGRVRQAVYDFTPEAKYLGYLTYLQPSPIFQSVELDVMSTWTKPMEVNWSDPRPVIDAVAETRKGELTISEIVQQVLSINPEAAQQYADIVRNRISEPQELTSQGPKR